MIKKIITFYLCILLILTSYQDFFLVNNFGEVFRTTMPFFIPLFLIVEITIFFKKRALTVTTIQKYFGLFIILLIIISIFSVGYVYFSGNYYYQGENLFYKSIKGFVYLFLILLYLRHLYFIFLKLDIPNIRLSFIWAITVLNIILIIEYVTMPNALLFLHSNQQEYNRVRLLTSESSWTGTIYIVYCGIALYLSRKLNRNFIFFYTILSFLFFAVLSESKGFLLVVILSSIPFIVRKTNLKSYLLILFFILLLGLSWIFYFSEIFLSHFSSDIENFTSVSTRIGLILAAIKIFFFHPFGVGTGAYIYYLGTGIPDIFPWLKFIFEVLFSSYPNNSELISLSKETTGLSVKSGILQWILYGGVFALIFFTKTFKYIKSRVGNVILLYCLYFIVFSSLLYISFDIKYELWLFIAFIEAMITRQALDEKI